MSANMEIKARAGDFPRLEEAARNLSDTPVELIHQEDTFFIISRGRLKLRKFPDGSGELIFYERDDEPGPAQSEYHLSRVKDASSLEDVLAKALGVLGQVRKTRRLFLAGQTRIHLDRVEGLGDFLELEVVLRPGQSPEEGAGIARDLLDRLGIRKEDLIGRAYIDLLLEKTGL